MDASGRQRGHGVFVRKRNGKERLMPSVKLTYGEMQTAARQLQVLVVRLRAGIAVAQTLKAPAAFVAQPNDNYLENAPIYQCFYSAGYYVIWTFFVIAEISSGKIVTAYGRQGRTVNESCP